MIFPLANATKKKLDQFNVYVYSTKEDCPDVSSAMLEVRGKHGMMKTRYSDRVYLVLEGNGYFEISGKVESVARNDVMIIPKNTPFDFWVDSGEMRLFLISAPAYEPEDDIWLD